MQQYIYLYMWSVLYVWKKIQADNVILKIHQDKIND